MSIITHDTPNDTKRYTVPPVTCAPWCEQGDGHPDEIFVEDQTCWGPDARTITANGELTATLCRRIGETTHVMVCIDPLDHDRPMAELYLSPEFFAEWLAMAQQNVVAVLEETGGADQR